MPNHPTMKSIDRVWLLVLVWFTLGTTVAAAAECTKYELVLPDLSTLKLPDGEHTVGTLDTKIGKLEARVTVKNKVVSDPRPYRNGILMKATPDSELPKDLLTCDQKAELPSGNQFANAARSLMDWIVPTAYAAGCTWHLVVKCTYNMGTAFCCARFVCGSRQSQCYGGCGGICP